MTWREERDGILSHMPAVAENAGTHFSTLGQAVGWAWTVTGWW